MAVRDGFDGSIKYSADVLDSWNEHLWMEMNRAKCVLFLIASLCPSRKGSISLERIAISFFPKHLSKTMYLYCENAGKFLLKQSL